MFSSSYFMRADLQLGLSVSKSLVGNLRPYLLVPTFSDSPTPPPFRRAYQHPPLLRCKVGFEPGQTPEHTLQLHFKVPIEHAFGLLS